MLRCCTRSAIKGIRLNFCWVSIKKNSIQYLLGERFEKIWISPRTRKTPQVTVLKASSDDILYKKLESQLSSDGRYHIGININGGKGHVITAERLPNGKMIYYDAQSGDFIKLEEYKDRGVEYIEFLKVDKLLPAYGFVKINRAFIVNS